VHFNCGSVALRWVCTMHTKVWFRLERVFVWLKVHLEVKEHFWEERFSKFKVELQHGGEVQFCVKVLFCIG